jgi:hypothetical protein
VGDADGAADGDEVGDAEGDALGAAVGPAVGMAVGAGVGDPGPGVAPANVVVKLVIGNTSGFVLLMLLTTLTTALYGSTPRGMYLWSNKKI